jgi:acetyl esterase
MARDIAGDIRLDPRVRAFLADDEFEPQGDVDSREALLAEANSAEARAGAQEFRQFMGQFDTEEAAPSAGLCIHTEKVTSQPDGNTIHLQVIRPDNDEALPCVYYIHGGGMGFLSCFDGIFRGGGSSSPRTAWPSSWSTSAMRSSRPRRRRWRPSRPG